MTAPDAPLAGYIYLNNSTGETITYYKSTGTSYSNKSSDETSLQFITPEALINYLASKPSLQKSSNALSLTEMKIITDIASSYGLSSTVDYIGPKDTDTPFIVILDKAGQKVFNIRNLADEFFFNFIYKDENKTIFHGKDWDALVKEMHVKFAAYAEPILTVPNKDKNTLSQTEMMAIDKLAKKYMLQTEQSPPSNTTVPYMSISGNMGYPIWEVRKFEAMYEVLNVSTGKHEKLEIEAYFQEMLFKLNKLFKNYIAEPQKPENTAGDNLTDEEKNGIAAIVHKHVPSITYQFTPGDTIVIWIGNHLTSYKVIKEHDVYRVYTDKDSEWVIQNQSSTYPELTAYLEDLLAHISKALKNSKLELPLAKTEPSALVPDMLSPSEVAEVKKLIKKFKLPISTSYTKKLMEVQGGPKENNAHSLVIIDDKHDVYIKIIKSQGKYIISKGFKDAYFPLKKFGGFDHMLSYLDYFLNSYIKEEPPVMEKISDQELNLIKDLVKKYKVGAKIRRKYMTSKGSEKVPYVFIKMDDIGMNNYALSKTAKGTYKLFQLDDWIKVATTDNWEGMYEIVGKVLAGEPLPDEKEKYNPSVLNPDQFEWLQTYMKIQKPTVEVKMYGNGVIGGYDPTNKIHGESNPLFVIRFAPSGKIILQVQTEDGGMGADEYPFNTVDALFHFIVQNLEVVTQLLKGDVAPESKLASVITNAGFDYVNHKEVAQDEGGIKSGTVYENDKSEQLYLYDDGSSSIWYFSEPDGKSFKKKKFSDIAELVGWMETHYASNSSEELKNIKEYLAYLGFKIEGHKSNEFSTVWTQEIGTAPNSVVDGVELHADGSSKVVPAPLGNGLIAGAPHESLFSFNTYEALKQYLSDKYVKGKNWVNAYFKQVLVEGKFQKISDQLCEMGFKWVTDRLIVVPFLSGGTMQTVMGVEPKLSFSFENTYDLAKRIELFLESDTPTTGSSHDVWSTGDGTLDKLISEAGFKYQYQGEEDAFGHKKKLVFKDAFGTNLYFYINDKTSALQFPPNSLNAQKSIGFTTPKDLIDYLKKYAKTSATQTAKKDDEKKYEGLDSVILPLGFESMIPSVYTATEIDKRWFNSKNENLITAYKDGTFQFKYKDENGKTMLHKFGASDNMATFVYNHYKNTGQGKFSKQKDDVGPTDQETGDTFLPSGETYEAHAIAGNAELIWLNEHDTELLQSLGFVPVPSENRYYKGSTGNIIKFFDTGKAEYIDYFGHPEKPENGEVVEFDNIPHVLKFMVAKHSSFPFSVQNYKSDDGANVQEIPLNQHDNDVLKQLGFEWDANGQKYFKFPGENDTPKLQEVKKTKEDPNQTGLPFGGPLHPSGSMPDKPVSNPDWEDQYEVFTAYDTGKAIWQRIGEEGEKELEQKEGSIANILQFIWKRWKHQLASGLMGTITAKGLHPPSAGKSFEIQPQPQMPVDKKEFKNVIKGLGFYDNGTWTFYNSMGKELTVDPKDGRVTYNFQYIADDTTGELLWGQTVFYNWPVFVDFLKGTTQVKPKSGKLPFTPHPATKELPKMPPPGKGPPIKGKIQLPFSGYDYEGWAKGTEHDPKATIKLMPDDDKTLMKLGWAALQTENDAYYYVHGKTGDMAYFFVDGHAQLIPKGKTPITLPKVKMALDMIWAEYGFSTVVSNGSDAPAQPKSPKSNVIVALNGFGFFANIMAPVSTSIHVFTKHDTDIEYTVEWDSSKDTIEFTSESKPTGMMITNWTDSSDAALKILKKMFKSDPKSNVTEVLNDFGFSAIVSSGNELTFEKKTPDLNHIIHWNKDDSTLDYISSTTGDPSVVTAAWTEDVLVGLAMLEHIFTPKLTEQEFVAAKMEDLGFKLLGGKLPTGTQPNTITFHRTSKDFLYDVIYHAEQKMIEFIKSTAKLEKGYHKIVEQWTLFAPEAFTKLETLFKGVGIGAAGFAHKTKKKVLAGTEDMPWSGTDYLQWGNTVLKAMGTGKGMSLYPTEVNTLKQLGWNEVGNSKIGYSYENGNQKIMFHPSGYVEYWSSEKSQPTQNWTEIGAVEDVLRWLWKKKGLVQKKSATGEMPWSNTDYNSLHKIQMKTLGNFAISLIPQDENVLKKIGFEKEIVNSEKELAFKIQYHKTTGNDVEVLYFFADGQAAYWINGHGPKYYGIKSLMKLMWDKYGTPIKESVFKNYMKVWLM